MDHVPHGLPARIGIGQIGFDETDAAAGIAEVGHQHLGRRSILVDEIDPRTFRHKPANCCGPDAFGLAADQRHFVL